MSDLFHATMAALERSLTCSLVASGIDLKNDVFSSDTSDSDLVAFALRNRFSRVPLRNQEQSGKGTITDVAIVDLEAERLVERRGLTVDDLIAGDTPIGPAIQVVNERGFCFVLVRDTIRQILTRSDLNKPPVRVYLSARLSHLEGLLAAAITQLYPDNRWLEKLSELRQSAIHDLYQQKISDDFDTNLIDCTSLSDKAAIIGKSTELRGTIVPGSRKQFDRRFSSLKELRNRLCHNLPPLSEEADLLRNHLYHGQQLVKQRDLSWLATVVSHLDEWVGCLAPMTQEMKQEELRDAT